MELIALRLFNHKVQLKCNSYIMRLEDRTHSVEVSTITERVAKRCSIEIMDGHPSFMILYFHMP